jgi:hypothetical protein
VATGYLVGRIVLAYTLLPRYYEGNLVTAYALLEKALRSRDARVHVDRVHGHARHGGFGARVRDRGAHRVDHRAAAAAGAVMPVAVLVLGTLTVIYTIRGGMRAVVWTEIVQASVYISADFGDDPRRRLVPGGWGSIFRPRAPPASCKSSLEAGSTDPNTMAAGSSAARFCRWRRTAPTS